MLLFLWAKKSCKQFLYNQEVKKSQMCMQQTSSQLFVTWCEILNLTKKHIEIAWCVLTQKKHTVAPTTGICSTHTLYTLYTLHTSTTTGDMKKSESKLTLNHLNNKSIQNHWKKNTWCHSTNQRKARGLLRKLDFNFLQTGSALITKNSKMLLFCFYNWAKGHCIAMWRTRAQKNTFCLGAFLILTGVRKK